jgi:hypothetical protein
MRILYSTKDIEDLIRSNLYSILDSNIKDNLQDIKINIYEIDDVIEAEVVIW